MDVTRLRAIVRGSGRRPPVREPEREPAGPASSVPTGRVPVRAGEPGALLGGALERQDDGSWLIVRRAYAPVWRHGIATVEASARQLEKGLDVLAGSPGAAASMAQAGGTPLFVDIETTGLSGGAGTIAFLVGIGWFEQGGFHTCQHLLARFGGEQEMLAGVADVLRRASALVTFNGKSFDLPIMETRWLYHRMGSPVGAVAHVDMLPPARRLWSGEGSGLTDLERGVLRFWRRGDIASAEVPAHYVAYLRSGQLGLLAPVLEHNRLDLLSLAVVTAGACRLVAGGAPAAEGRRQCLGLGHVFERAGAIEAALACYRRAARGDERWDAPSASSLDAAAARAEALSRVAVHLRRQRQFKAAASAWATILQLGMSPARYEREAMLALAVHHEHRDRNLTAAQAHARRALGIEPTPRGRQALQRRLRRLDEKLVGMAERQAAVDRLVR